jgi:hypothetical protein
VPPVRLGGDAQIDARLLAPEQVGSDRNEALFSQFVAGLADIGVHPNSSCRTTTAGAGNAFGRAIRLRRRRLCLLW